MLYVVATPIGNLEDLTARARSVLSQVDIVLAEDTRHSGRLLTHLGLTKTLHSLHEHNESKRVEQVLGWLEAGKTVALISDAGTPLISDPGYGLVSACRKAGFDVSPIPGACALIAALSCSGLPSDRFLFVGFLNAKRTARQKQLRELAEFPHTIILYESSHRILDCLHDCCTVLGAERQIVVGREITKKFEHFYRGSAEEVLNCLQSSSNHQRGEFVAVGICTHLGCVPTYRPDIGGVEAGWPGGFFCPCHGSKFDLAGRVYQGVPAPTNLEVPPYRYLTDSVLLVGEGEIA